MSNRIHSEFCKALKRFKSDSRGTSAIEFGLIAPILITVVVALADINDLAFGSSNMQSAVRAGIQYALKGGTDPTTAQSQADAAWTRKPSGATITASKSCKCAGNSHVCNVVCDLLDLPEIYMTVTATATLGGNLYSTTKTVTETVRVR
jgi:Flp pilus assembly protein TadG